MLSCCSCLGPESVIFGLLQVLGLPDYGHADVAHSRPRWPLAHHAAPKLQRLARSLSKGRLAWSGA